MIDSDVASGKSASLVRHLGEMKFDPKLTKVILEPREEEVEDGYSYKFSRTGVFKMKGSHSVSQLDLLDTMVLMSKPALKLFVAIKCKTDRKTNLATINKPADKTEESSRSRAVNELIRINVIAKAGVRRFMVNPHHIQPAAKYLKQAHQEWYDLTGEALTNEVGDNQ